MSAPTTECPVPANELFCNELADDRRKANWNDDGTLGTYMTLYSCLKRVKVNIEVSYFIYCRDLDPSDWATGWWLSTSQPQICHMVDDGCWKVSLQLETVVWGDANEMITGCMLDWIPTSTWTYYLPLENCNTRFQSNHPHRDMCSNLLSNYSWMVFAASQDFHLWVACWRWRNIGKIRPTMNSLSRRDEVPFQASLPTEEMHLFDLPATWRISVTLWW